MRKRGRCASADTTPASAASAVATSRRPGSTGAPPPTPVQLRLSDGADVDASAQGPDQETRERANAQERSSADVVLFQKLIADKKVHELDITRAGGVSKPQMLKVLAMFGGCEHLFPSSARTKAGAIKKQVAFGDLRAALIAKMQEDGFAEELAEARRALDARPCVPWTPEDNSGRGAAVASAGGVDAARSASRGPHQKTTNRNLCKTRARTAAADFTKSGWHEQQQGKSVFCDGLFPGVSVPVGEGDVRFEAAVDFILGRIGARLQPHASVSAIVQALNREGICICGEAKCGGGTCEESGVAHVRQKLLQNVRRIIRSVASSVLREEAHSAGWSGDWGEGCDEHARKRTKTALGLVSTPTFMASPVRAAVEEHTMLPAAHPLRQAPPPLRDALSEEGTGFIRVPLPVRDCKLPTVETALRKSRRDCPNFAKGQREIVAHEKSKLGDNKRARFGSVAGNDFLAGLCCKIGEGPHRAIQLWHRTPGDARTSETSSA